MREDIIYSTEQIKDILLSTQNIFEYVRLVDPKDSSIVTIIDNDLVYSKNTCFKVWQKSKKCENCISKKGLLSHSNQSKYEKDNTNYYYVISKPIKLLCNNKVVYLMMEIVNKVEDILLSDKINSENLLEIIIKTHEKAYKDYMTDAYNRRYLDEYLFLYNSKLEASKELIFIYTDLKKFKEINDTYGHHIGDKVLVKVVGAVKKCISKNDSIVRIGGDEFLIIISNGKESQIPVVIEKINKALSLIRIDEEDKVHINANFGSMHIKDFKPNKKELAKIIEQLDKLMYKNKQSQI